MSVFSNQVKSPFRQKFHPALLVLWVALCFSIVPIGETAETDASTAFSTAIRLPSPEIETLPNGLQVAWFVDEKLPVIDLGMLFINGTRKDPAGKSGLSYLTSQLLERGPIGKTAVDFSRSFEKLGGSFGVNVDEDGTSLSIHGLSRDANVYFDLLADVILKPAFDGEEMKKIQAEEADRFQHLGDSAEGLASYAFARWMTAGSPYARGSVESLPEWKKLTRADVTEHYENHFSPKQAILMIVGRVNKTEFRQRVLQRFSPWVAKDLGKRASLPSPRSYWKAPKTKILLVNRPGLPQAQVRFGFPVPEIHSKNRYALTVGNALLGEYFNSRLNSVIRDELGLAYGIGSSLNYAKDLAYLGISSATAIQHVPVLIRETTRILESFKKGQISSQEVLTAKEYLMGGYPMSVSTLGAVAGRWLAGVVYGLGPDFLNEYIPEVDRVDHTQVISAVKEAFHLDDLKIVVAGDAKKLLPLLKKFKFNSVQVVEAKDLVKY
jgi:zinc protease